MRKLLLGLTGLVAALLVVIIARAVMIGGSRQPGEPVLPVDHVNATRIARRLGEAVRFQTVSVGDSEPTNVALDAMHDWMLTTYPRVFASLSRENFGRSLLLTWKGSDSSAAPLVLMAHMDVVPVESGTESKWAHGAFSGDVADGFVWGRGTLDDKLNVVGELEAIDTLIASGFRPRRTVMLSFGENEESFGSGARAIAAQLKARNVHPLMVIDEGGVVIADEVPGLRRPVALIGVGEKGYLNVELVAASPGGHSSMPPNETATGIVAAAVANLEAHPMAARLTGPLRNSIDAIAPEVSFGARIVLANMWLFGPAAKAYLARKPESNATLRTTTAPTMFEAGVKDNVLPARARAVVNFRLIPGDSISTVLEHVRKVINDSRVAIRPLIGAEPSPLSDVNSPAYALLARTIRETMPDAVVVPYVLVAATDSRNFTGLTPNVLRFSPMRIAKSDMARIHGTNERVGIDNLGELVTFFTTLVRNADKP